MNALALIFTISLMLVSLCAPTAAAGLSFSHNDWELACDNTRTCRAAGYHSDEDELPISVLLTRPAGPRQAITGELMLGDFSNEEFVQKLPAVLKLSMRVNGRSLGPVVVTKESLTAKLSTNQVTALLEALPRKSNIEWILGKQRWHLSDLGAAAVLLKMDELQGRLGTPGALLKKGTKSESAVLPALPKPVLIVPPVAKPRATDALLATKQSKALRQALRATLKDEECSGLVDEKSELSITRISEKHLLVSTPCWLAAYNSGDGYWVIHDAAPYQPVLVTTAGSDFDNGSISVAQKGRGLGDCLSFESLTWDGKRFVQTQISTTGMCKSITPGGAWSLPTLTTEVRPSAR